MSAVAQRNRRAGFLVPARVIRRAGYVADRIRPYYWIGKIVPAGLVPLLLREIGMQWSVTTCIVSGLFAFFAADYWLVWQMKRRQRRIAHSLSYFVDMTTTFLKGGMSLETAIGAAIEYGLPPRSPLRRELELVRSEIDAGRSREEAFAALWRRTGVSEVHSFTNALRIGFAIGSPIVTTLESLAGLLRERERERGHKRIHAKTRQAMVPLILLNFPLMVIIVFYPPLLEFASLFLSF